MFIHTQFTKNIISLEINHHHFLGNSPIYQHILSLFFHHNLLFNNIISHYNEPVSYAICVSALNI